MSSTEKEGFEQAVQQNSASIYDGLTLRCCAAKAEWMRVLRFFPQEKRNPLAFSVSLPLPPAAVDGESRAAALRFFFKLKKDIRGPLAKTKSCPQGTSSLMSLRK